jgi:cytochrome b6-f complex iron-sulfur subunit
MVDATGRTAAAISRRTFLAACLPAAACARGRAAPEGPRPVSLPVARFPEGVRVTVSVAGHPVEVLRTASAVTARSLLCTHQGCEVAWSEAAQAYLCPCHEGKYDPEGRPKEGPPPKPLATVAARLDGDFVLVGP